MSAALKLFIEQSGTTVAGKKIEVILRDASSWKGANERALARQAQIAELAAGAAAGRLDAEGLFRLASDVDEEFASGPSAVNR